MRTTKLWISAFFVVSLLGPVTPPLHAGNQPGSTIPIVITFRDCTDLQCAAADRIRSDWNQSYNDGENGVEAFIGTQANSGNVGLRLNESPRGLSLDFTECVSPESCRPPPSQVYPLAFIRVDATAVRKNGVLGMAVNETVSVPMRVYYRLLAEQGPGFIDFNPNLTGKSACKGASDFVSVIRTGEGTWEIFADPTRIGCVTLPDNAGWAGNYHFPFHFTVHKK